MKISCGCSVNVKTHARRALVYHTSRRNPLKSVSYCNGSHFYSKARKYFVYKKTLIC